MNVRDLIPWGRSNNAQAPANYRSEEANPFLSLHRDVNRLFDDVFRSLDRGFPSFGPLSTVAAGWPSVEISETEKTIKVTAEVPGLDDKDIEVMLNDGVLTIKGEKRSETEDKEKQFSERYYGRFERHIQVGPEVEQDHVEASFKNGVLTVTLPKTEKAQTQVKRIEIKS